MKAIVSVLFAGFLVFAMMTTAYAGDEFERGFKTELGAISARAAVGLGIGLVTGVVHEGPYYRAYPAPVYIERHVYVKPHPRWRHVPRHRSGYSFYRHHHERHHYRHHHKHHRCY